ncbi:hypothetical protein HN51_044500 [Arachis hypogaea]
MEERRRGCSVATEAPSPLLGLVDIVVLPPSGCCAAAEELEGMSRHRRALPPSCCVAAHLFFTVAAHHQRRILCHQVKFSVLYPPFLAHSLTRFHFSVRNELDAVATKLQKVNKSYRTRRNLADCAVVVEELWWKALDFAALKRSSILFFDVEKQESAVSRWARARTRAAKAANLRERFEQHRHVDLLNGICASKKSNARFKINDICASKLHWQLHFAIAIAYSPLFSEAFMAQDIGQ